MKGLTAVIYGESKIGKSWLADTVPGPRLILDAEGKSDWTPSNKIPWNPREAIPECGPDDSVVVQVLDFSDMGIVLQWLQSGQHPFRSVVMDSLTEAQERSRKTIFADGNPKLQQQYWGQLLMEVGDFVTTLKDLKRHPTNPLAAVIFVCAAQNKDNSVRPFIQGSLQVVLPYKVDVVGYLFQAPTEENPRARALLIGPRPGIIAGDNTDLLTTGFGDVISEPDLGIMLEKLNAG